MAFANNAELSIYFETFGNIADPTLVLINGLSNQCIAYRDEFCQLFVEAGFHVIRFDNRDVGLSSDGPEGYSLKDMRVMQSPCLMLSPLRRLTSLGYH